MLGITEIIQGRLFERVHPCLIKKDKYIANINGVVNAVILEDTKQRDLFLEETNSKGVMTRPIWTLMSKLKMFNNAQCGNLKNSEWLECRVVNIPSSVLII